MSQTLHQATETEATRMVTISPETQAMTLSLRETTTRVMTMLMRLNQVTLQTRMVASLHREAHSLAMLTLLEEQVRLVNQASLDLADQTLLVSQSLV